MKEMEVNRQEKSPASESSRAGFATSVDLPSEPCPLHWAVSQPRTLPRSGHLKVHL